MTTDISMAATEARRAYQRQWRKNNPDKVKEQNRRYWERKGREFLQNPANFCKKGDAREE